MAGRLACVCWISNHRGNEPRMSSNSSINYPKQVVIDEPLWSFMHHCEVYCSGACCGVEAFEVHRAMLLRKVVDMNLVGLDGAASFCLARRQMTELRQHVASENIQVVNDEIPFWTSGAAELPQFWLSKEEVAGWLEQWEVSFDEASRYGGLAEGKA